MSVLKEVQELFVSGALEAGSSAAITSPDHLAEELFTHRGSGTSVHKGEKIIVHTSLDTIDHAALKSCVERAFGNALPADYFEKIRPKLKKIYVLESLRGAAIVLNEGGFSYLDKFAVLPDVQGEKLGEALWDTMVSSEPNLFWRSKATNKVNPWYFSHAHGSYRSRPGVVGAKPTTGAWTVFWINLEDADASKAVDMALMFEPTFKLIQSNSNPVPEPETASA